jgi:carbamoyltransferase
LRLIDDRFDATGRLLFSEHHRSHAASAFFPSPFEEALVLTMDGGGEGAISTIALGRGNRLEIIRETHFPHSLGLLYSTFTSYTGFKVNSGEYKVMGLAPYGDPCYLDKIFENLVYLKPDGRFLLNLDYFNYRNGLATTNRRFNTLFGGPPRRQEDPLTQRCMNLAASVQAATEDILLHLTRSLASTYGIPNLCLAGEVALNCVANGKILRDGHFQKIWVQPAAGNAGCALGAALAAYHGLTTKPRKPKVGDGMAGSYLGPAFVQDEIERRLQAVGAHFHVLDDPTMIARTAQALADGRAVGWFQGRMEFGPRALGNRSILGDPRSPTMQKALNLKVKYRESFRPFAPSILREDLSDWFELACDSPYMLLVADVVADRRKIMTEGEQSLIGLDKLNIPRSDIPAVTHVDYSARVQTVTEDANPRFHSLLTEFKRLTGCPVVVNTSFNVRGEPIVGSPEDAFRCFMGTGIETLVVGNAYLVKEDQDPALKSDYKDAFELD